MNGQKSRSSFSLKRDKVLVSVSDASESSIRYRSERIIAADDDAIDTWSLLELT